jgi:AraC-like DNA-binding protein
MNTIRSAMPDPRLRQFVRCFAQREISGRNSWVVQTSIASLEHTLAFCFGDQPVMQFSSGNRALIPRIHVVGTQTRSPGCARFTGSTVAFGIFLSPFACWRLFRIPSIEFTDRDFEGEQVFGPWITNLWLKLAECKTFGDRINVANGALLPFAANANPLTMNMVAARSLLRPGHSKRIPQLARESYMSTRNFQRKFAEDTGISPKLFARLGRFQLALDMKRTRGNDWAKVAHELGYFDQMHMVKDFRAFGGDSPSRLIQICGDTQPWSIGTPMSPNRVMTTEMPSSFPDIPNLPSSST